MKKLIIFEGIASSGKTTVSKIVKEKLCEELSVSSIDENKTLMPLIYNTDPSVAIMHIKEILKEVKNLVSDIIIIDRLLFTHIFRTKSNFDFFNDTVNTLLRNFGTNIFVLSIPENKIAQRVQDTQEIRGDKWTKGKRGSMEEKVKYYTEQQRILLSLADTSSITTTIIDTAEQSWSKYADIIVSKIH